jgi:hypothetical protein
VSNLFHSLQAGVHGANAPQNQEFSLEDCPSGTTNNFVNAGENAPTYNFKYGLSIPLDETPL